MMIKTIRKDTRNLEKFDLEVNAALAEGWKLKRTTVIESMTSKDALLVAELVKDEPTTVQSLNFEVSLDMDEAKKQIGDLLGSTAEVKIKYFDTEIDPIQATRGGDWIDLRTAEAVSMKAGEYRLIRLGVGMILPDGYEAHVVPRSSTFKNFGIIQANSFGVIDNSYSGDADEWHFPAYALRDTEIEKNARICQFRIVRNQPEIRFSEVAKLNSESRGGIGSTGRD